MSSGSDGNSIFIEGAGARVLIDAGISARKIEEGLTEYGVDPCTLNALFITHEHSDHNKSMGILQRRYGFPVYGTAETLCASIRQGTQGRIAEESLRYVTPGTKIEINGLTVSPYSVSHDAANPVAYCFSDGEKKIGMATDLGFYDDYVKQNLMQSDLLYLESNHDVNMLMVGRYPYYLKQRILGDHGHLSNDACASLCCELLHDGLKGIVLAHLSAENNMPELAYETVKAEVKKACGDRFEMPDIAVAKRGCVSVYREI